MAATKATKRGTEAAAQVQDPKRARLDPLLVGVLDAVRQAEGLSEASRAMIAAGVPSCFATLPGERHKHQARLVSWIGEILERVQSKMKETVKAAEASGAEADGRRRELEKSVEEAKSALTTEDEAVASREAVLAEASQAVVAAKAELQERQQAQHQGDATLESASAEKETLDKALETQVAFLTREEGYDAAQAAQHVSYLAQMAECFGLDESLLAALRTAATMPLAARGAFDVLALEELEASMRKRAGEFGEQLEAAVVARAECAAAVLAAQSQVESAEEAERAAATALAAAWTHRGGAAGGLESAEAALAAFELERGAAKAEQEEKAAALQNFIGYNIECFQMLCNQAVTAGA